MKGRVLLLGASSAIARSVAAALAARGCTLCLAGRDLDDLHRASSDLKIRYGATVSAEFFDAEDYAAHEEFLEKVLESMGGIDGVILAFGYLGDQEKAAREFIVGISSVAGDRGRARNYVYGAAKGAVSLYLQGLRARLSSAGVRVITVKLGFVDTAMTFDLPGLFCVASPEYIGNRIARVLRGSRDIVYLPWFWRYIMWVIRLIPERLFKRMKWLISLGHSLRSRDSAPSVNSLTTFARALRISGRLNDSNGRPS
jgi:short-subunit dehydrogenase